MNLVINSYYLTNLKGLIHEFKFNKVIIIVSKIVKQIIEIEVDFIDIC